MGQTSSYLSDLITLRDGHANNFDIIRLVAALMVLVSHAFPLSGDLSLAEPMAIATKGQATGGHVAVQIFFFISGFLVMRSLERSRSLVRFSMARILRIFPGLFVAVCFGALIVGPLFTTLPLSEYFAHPQFDYYFRTTHLDVQYALPAVFLEHPNGAVNGSLWSLEIEGIMYLCIPLMLLVPKILRRWAALVVLLVCIVLIEGFGLSVAEDGFYTFYIVILAQFFAAGAAAFLWRDMLRLHWIGALGAAAVLVWTARHGDYFNVASVLPGGYLILWIAYCAPKMASVLNRVGDLSYGVYIYAFPIQQVVYATLALGATWWGNALLSIPPTLLLAWLSWRLVEKPAMSLRRPVCETLERTVAIALRKRTS